MPPSFNAKMRFCPCAALVSPSAEDSRAIPQFSPEFTPLPFPHRTARIAWLLCDIPEVRNHAITLYYQFLRHIETDTDPRSDHHHFFGCSARTYGYSTTG